MSISSTTVSGLLEPTARENPDISGLPERSEKNDASDLYYVTILDNDTNTYQEVIDICMEALGINFHQAMGIALAIDNNGFAVVAQAPEMEARRIASTIASIGIEVKVSKDFKQNEGGEHPNESSH